MSADASKVRYAESAPHEFCNAGLLGLSLSKFCNDDFVHNIPFLSFVTVLSLSLFCNGDTVKLTIK